MKLLGSTKSKIAKDKTGEKLPYLEITKVVLRHCNIVNIAINKMRLFLINRLINY